MLTVAALLSTGLAVLLAVLLWRVRLARRREYERADLWHRTWVVSSRIRRGIDADQLLHDAVDLVGSAFHADRAYIRLVVHGRLENAAAWPALPGPALPGPAPAGTAPAAPTGVAGPHLERLVEPLDRLRAMYGRAGGAAPARLRAIGSASVLTMPFGIGDDLLGALVLVRRAAWSPAEVEAVHAVAGDLAQGIDMANRFRWEHDRVARLRDLDEAKSEFLSTASHELRTPLTSITGYLETLLDGDAGPITAKQRKMLTTIDRNGHRLRSLIDDLLTLSQVEAGTFRFVRRPVDLADLVADAVADIQPTATRANVSLGWRHPGTPVVIEGDQDQLHRVVANLLSNAVKFTPAGGRVSVGVAQEGDGHARLTVADTGIGIPAEDQSQLFQRFFRASNATGRVIQGTGLGLTIVKAIVTHHGGQLEVSSVEQEGTTITILLPGAAAVAAPAPSAVEPAPAPAPASSAVEPAPAPAPSAVEPAPAPAPNAVEPAAAVPATAVPATPEPEPDDADVRQRRVVVADDLAELTGPIRGVVELPADLLWLPYRTFDLDDPGYLRWMYESLLREATGIEQLRAWLHGPTLVRLWPELYLPISVRQAWQGRHPALRAAAAQSARPALAPAK